MKIDTNKVLFNAAGVLCAVFALGWVLNDQLTVKRTSACAKRYAVSALFPIQNADGTPLTPIDLQAMAGPREYNVLDLAKVHKVRGAPAPLVMEVTIPKGEGRPPRGEAAPRSGVGLQWFPGDVRNATSACLVYDAYLPSDFEFGDGGMLPGLFGGSRFDGYERGQGTDGFASRVMWREGGVGEVHVQVPRIADKAGASVGRDKFQLPRGRWVTIEQEIELNTPPKSDGKLRLWIDGELRIEKDKLHWRDDAATSIEGVVGNIGFGTVDRPGSAPKDATVRITPYELRWK